jgi:hypothetical protein
VVRRGSKSEHSRDTYLKEIRPRLQTLITTLHSTMNTTGKDPYIQFKNQSEHSKDTRLKEIGPRLQTLLTTLHSTMNTIGKGPIYPVTKSTNTHFR